MTMQSLLQTYKRFRTLQSSRISTMPIVILMPHSACNCRCVMCDIWKGNKHITQLNKDDIKDLLISLKKLGTKQVVISGGEALLHPDFFDFCRLLQQEQLKITLLSTGITLRKHADALLESVNEIIVSIDGDQTGHDKIRNITGAFANLEVGVKYIKLKNPKFPIRSRTVIHRLNFRIWKDIIHSAREIGLDQVSFLPADISSQAFNRQVPWDEKRQEDIQLSKEELPELKQVIETLFTEHRKAFDNHFIAESREKIMGIYSYYAALQGEDNFPHKRCNAPWVSAVIEPDGSIRPCFFHPAIGNIHANRLEDIINSNTAIKFRKSLNVGCDPTCVKCVCSLYLSPAINPADI